MIVSVILRDIIITFTSLSHHQHQHSDDNHSDDNQCNPQGHHYHIIITLSSLSHNHHHHPDDNQCNDQGQAREGADRVPCWRPQEEPASHVTLCQELQTGQILDFIIITILSLSSSIFIVIIFREKSGYSLSPLVNNTEWKGFWQIFAKMIFLPNFQNMQICSAFAIFAIIMKMMISLSLRSRLLRQFSGATTPPGLRGGGAKCFQARRVEMDHPSGCHDAGGDGGDDDVADNLRGADVSAGVDGKGRVCPIRMN